MRCARCDRLAVPQAVGRTTDGLVVFGWCLSCLAETGCRDVMVAGHDLPGPLSFRRLPPSPRRSEDRPVASKEERARPHPRADPIAERRKLLAAVALILALWGAVLVVAGL